MAHRVVRPFPLSLDGLTLIDLNVGDERSDWGGMECGLKAEGYIEPVKDSPVQSVEQSAEPQRRRGR